MSCPDCHGILEVEVEGRKGHLHFRCRVGHAYSLAALLAAKEQVLENRLWTVVMAMEELATLLGELETHATRLCWSDVEEPCRARRETLHANAHMLRELIGADKPVDLGFDKAGSEEPESGTFP